MPPDSSRPDRRAQGSRPPRAVQAGRRGEAGRTGTVPDPGWLRCRRGVSSSAGARRKPSGRTDQGVERIRVDVEPFFVGTFFVKWGSGGAGRRLPAEEPPAGGQRTGGTTGPGAEGWRNEDRARHRGPGRPGPAAAPRRERHRVGRSGQTPRPASTRTGGERETAQRARHPRDEERPLPGQARKWGNVARRGAERSVRRRQDAETDATPASTTGAPQGDTATEQAGGLDPRRRGPGRMGGRGAGAGDTGQEWPPRPSASPPGPPAPAREPSPASRRAAAPARDRGRHPQSGGHGHDPAPGGTGQAGRVRLRRLRAGPLPRCAPGHQAGGGRGTGRGGGP